MSLGERLFSRQSLTERFINYRTFRGGLLLAIGWRVAWYAHNDVANVIQESGVLVGIFLASEGIRELLSNRVQQSVRFDELKEAREKTNKRAEKEKNAEPLGMS